MMAVFDRLSCKMTVRQQKLLASVELVPIMQCYQVITNDHHFTLRNYTQTTEKEFKIEMTIHVPTKKPLL